MTQAGLPLLAALWFSAVTPVVLVDGIFVLTRSLDASVLHPLSEVFPFKYWMIYAKYDLRYGPNDDAFVIAQSWLNLAEVSLGLLVVLLSLLRFNNASVKLAILVATMTLYKTVLYFVLDIVEDGKFTKHNKFFEQLTMVIIPSSFWIIVPAIIIKQCFRVLALTNAPERKSKANNGKNNKSNNSQQKSATADAESVSQQSNNQKNNNNNKSNKKKQ